MICVSVRFCPRMVASKSIVVRASNPTIAAISIPPFKMNFSLYSDRAIRPHRHCLLYRPFQYFVFKE